MKTIFKSSSALLRNLGKVKPNMGKNMTKNSMYFILCSYFKEYKYEMS